MEFVPMTIKKQKNIALIAHDQKKHELMEWCKEHKSILEKLPYDAAYQRTMSKDNHTKMHKTADVAVEAFDPEERQNVIRLLNENLFTYNFQPIVNARSGAIYAYEALMRSGEGFRLSPLTILTHAEALDRLNYVQHVAVCQGKPGTACRKTPVHQQHTCLHAPRPGFRAALSAVRRRHEKHRRGIHRADRGKLQPAENAA